MRKSHREVQRAMKIQAGQLGASSYEFKMGGKHPYMEIRIGGKTGKVVYSSTSSDLSRYVKNTLKDVRSTVGRLRASIAKSPSQE